MPTGEAAADFRYGKMIEAQTEMVAIPVKKTAQVGRPMGSTSVDESRQR